ncbi:hypothetical protein [Streptomyces broussonetiae]|uniref:hypothetical protein n=1 Tax=Streptomyces broussonetiae TaxID=2686304 RepID=UPI0035D55993
MAIRVWLAACAVGLTVQDVRKRKLDTTGVVIADRDTEGIWRVLPWASLLVGAAGIEPWDSGPAGQPLQ